ncbi:ImmA/IrrE family metallo-endopeptidase [Providencia rettgeri]|nr:XRE family transcriptional regulator [Providencia rettgeri]MBS0858783.1 ImmA/IrrE family metallo-endopeptidase [Providencia rettgeri]MBS0872521.1 ImmA/IrrE family metallo-endopeptidase [Providencia rettgeri]MBS0919667.1 ImmA/IrrE family metallo-endopeptidase [Providencia rettgeri]MCL0015881.1 XRE family transcriptional regulator [Providencia rettgeri]
MTSTLVSTLHTERSINPNRLTEAREAKGLTMAELARVLDISRQAISSFEKGLKNPSPDTLSMISKVLGFPERFFLSNEGSPQIEGAVHFRSRSTATKKERIKGKTKGRWVSLIVRECMKYVQLPDVELPPIDIPDFEILEDADIEEIATKVRRYWNMGDGPISNLTRLLENKGIIVANLHAAEKVDAFSFWDNDRPIIITDNTRTAVRTRFSIAHELGHLILHRSVEDDYIDDKYLFEKVEGQANYFASCFLLPAKTFSREYYSPSLPALEKLKERWIVSLQCMTNRSNSLGLMSDNQKGYVYRQLAPYRKKEPLDDVIPREEPVFINKLINLLDSHSILLKNQLLDLFPLPIQDIMSITKLKENELLRDDSVLPFVLKKKA